MEKLKYLDAAKNLFLSKTNYKENEIKKIKPINQGFTNICFVLTTSDQKKYQVRIGGSNDIVDRQNEINFIKLIKDENYLYYDLEGNAIKKWIKGHNPKVIINKKLFLKLLLKEINKLQSIDYTKTKIIKFNPMVFFDLTDWTKKEKHKENYLKLIKEFEKFPLTLAHNDINELNIIYGKKTLHLIDFEWSRINYEYYDIANFFRETRMGTKWVKYICKLEPKYDYKVLIKFIYFSTCYALQWTYAAKQSAAILKYRQNVEKKMDKYLSWIENK